jgi:hypothetical protein
MISDPDGAPETEGPADSESDPQRQDRLKILGGSDNSGTWEAAVRGLIRSNQEIEAIAVAIEAPFQRVKAQAVSLLERRLRGVRKPDEQGRAVFEPAALRMLERLLSDPAPEIREEAKQVCLSLNVGGDEEQTLRLLLDSRFADVRAHVLAAIADRTREVWALDLLMQMLDDADTALRAEAYRLAAERGRGRGTQHLTWVLSGPHAALKQIALQELAERRGYAVEMLLSKALQDPDLQVACRAVDVIARAGATHLLLEALDGSSEGVRVAAARALATGGDAEGQPVLLAHLGTQASEEALEADLDALARLGEPVGESVRRLARHPSARVRAAAIRALAHASEDSDDEAMRVLRAARDDEAERVRAEAAVGLAIRGDTESLPMLRGRPHANRIEALEAMREAVALADVAAELLLHLTDHDDEKVRKRAMFFAVALDAARAQPTRTLCVRALSCKYADSRLAAIDALAPLFSEQGADAYLHGCLTDRGRWKPSRDVPQDTTQLLIAVVAVGPPRTRLHAVQLVYELFDDAEAFNAHWKRFFERYATDVRESLVRWKQRQSELNRQLVGAFASLVPDTPNVMPTLRRRRGPAGRAEPARLAFAWEGLRDAAGPLILLSCCDPDPRVREASEQALERLGLDPMHFGLADHAALTRALHSVPDEPESQSSRQELEPCAPPTPRGLEYLLALPAGTTAVPEAPAPAPAFEASGVFELHEQAPVDLLMPADVSQREDLVVRLAGEIVTGGAICDIFAFLGQSGWRGELVITEAGITRNIFFDHGNVVGAKTSHPSERLGEIMHRFGALDAEQRKQIESLLDTRQKFGQVAVRLGFVTEDELFSLISKQTCTIVFGGFAVKRGRFYFFDGFEEQDVATRHTLSATQLLMEGMSQQDEIELYRRKIPSAECVAERVPDKRPPPSHLADVYELVDGQRTVFEIGRASQLGEFAATKKLYELLQSRLIKMNAPDADREKVLEAANDALRQILEAVQRVKEPESFCRSLMESTSAQKLKARGYIIDGSAFVHMGEGMAETPATMAPPSSDAPSAGLHDYVGTALLLVETHVGAGVESTLRQDLKALLDRLRMSEQRGGSDQPQSSQSFHVKVLADSMLPKFESF